MKFENFIYQRVDIKETENKVNELINKINEANSFETQCLIIDEINNIRNEFTSMRVLSELRSNLGVDKEFYSEEMDYYADAEPILEDLVCDYYKALNSSKFKSLLKEKYGDHLFNLAEMKTKCISKDIIEDLQQGKKVDNRIC
ncbi:hypothetical protein M918_17200 [Clostridium sp. BL8]|uniref:hypothetical protein n=1 Tax=Clostridium sp. BL8 TaxID=1354301 RepID=UPI00038A293D|nr:hypothetical protein [Clostridium sp. BL8]EQB85883.1 hypothetical protein M918_17200 [Clostridium sp. BL8]